MGLKCVCTSGIDSLLNLSPLYTFVSKNVVSVSEISGGKLFASRRNSSTSVPHRYNVIDKSFPEDGF